MYTEEQKNARRGTLYTKSIRELVDYIIQLEEENQEAKDLRRRFMQVRNLVLEPNERRSPGRPRSH